MKKMVGKRENPNPGLREGMMLVGAFISGASKPTKIRFDETCSQCKAPVVILLSEDITTGEIWLEGPDKCSGCSHQLSDPNSKFQLTQEAIHGYFGKH